MKTELLSTVLLLALVSCGPNKHVNSWEAESSAFDGVGITAKKQAAKNRAETATYKPGESVTFKNTKLMVFELDPEARSSAHAFMKSGVDSAKVLLCGESFAKVEFPDGEVGFVSLTEIVNPMDSMNFYPLPDAEGGMLPQPAGLPGMMPVDSPLPGSSLPNSNLANPAPSSSSSLENVPLPESSVKQQ